MALRRIKFLDKETFHVYNRGNSKREIFHDVQDYERFRKMLYICNGTKKFKFKDLLKIEKDAYSFERGKPIVNIMCYTLMPNHFHLMISPIGNEPLPEGVNKNLGNNLSIFMRRLTASYSMYYNYKYARSGSLFEGRFKAEHVGSDGYFKYLFSYIHLNPIKLIQKNWKQAGIEDFKKAENFLQNYKYSSFEIYFNSPVPYGGVEKIVNTKNFLDKIEEGTDLGKEIFDWLKFETIE